MSLWARHRLSTRTLQSFNGRSNLFARQFTCSTRKGQADVVEETSPPRIRTYFAAKQNWNSVSPEFDDVATSRKLRGRVRSTKGNPTAQRPVTKDFPGRVEAQKNPNNLVDALDPILLRDLCSCPRCIDPSTKQKHFATADIPSDIRPRTIAPGPDGYIISWHKDIPGYGDDHKTHIPASSLEQLLGYGKIAPRRTQLSRMLWDAQMYEQQTCDIDYQSYMQDDFVLLKAVQQLHTHGLLFVTNVPGDEKSVEAVGERIGPLKTTFYGRTWDVRSVPEAINVAYTAQNLGFHMDLMYMKQPPHIQLLHCIRSSAKGGASLFSDSFKAAVEIADTDIGAWNALTKYSVDYHYDHPGSQYYHQSRPVVDQQPKQIGTQIIYDWSNYLAYVKHPQNSWWPKLNPADFIDNVSWSPPFQAPFATTAFNAPVASSIGDPRVPLALNRKIQKWHAAAKKFNELIHKPDVIYERLMKPGECVIFDNRRVLHARRAFEVGDAGSERWLRGAYLDKDPYTSKLKILTDQEMIAHEKLSDENGNEKYWQAMNA